jgi:hypothetical protein
MVFVANGGASTGCGPGTPQRAAAATAQQNRIDVSVFTCSGPQTSFEAATNCDGAIDRPSVRADVGVELRSLFSGLFGIASVEARAPATACVGTITRMEVDTQQFDNLTSALPVYVRIDDTYGGRGCFNSGGTPKLGQQCVIVRACERRGGFFPPLADDCTFGGSSPRSGFIEVRSSGNQPSDDCRGDPGGTSSQIGRIRDAIEDREMGFVCQVDFSGSSSSCSGSTSYTCVDRFINFPDDEGDHQDILNSVETRLESAPNGCDSFVELFDRVDGGAVARPWAGGNPTTTVYSRDPDCDLGDSGRVGIVVFVADSGAGSPRVKGFATVYILGCFERLPGGSTPMSSTQENECDGSRLDDHDIEVRGVLLRTFMPEAHAGDLGRLNFQTSGPQGDRNYNVPLTIETVE